MEEEYGAPAPEEQDNTLEELQQKFEDQRKRAEKAEAEAKELKGSLESLQKEPELQVQESKIKFDDLADNLSVLKPLDDDEVQELRSQAKEIGVDPITFAKSKAWKSHLDTLRQTKKAEDKTPEPSHRVAVFEGKSFADVVH